MAITSNFDRGRMEKEVQPQVDALNERILASFIRAGENFVIQAREQIQDHAMGTYKDQTTNLRNSIGYMIFRDGELVHSNQGKVVTNINDVQEHIKQDGFQLIGFAGMNYASYVESKGYNVISMQAETCLLNLSNYLQILQVIEKDTNAKYEEVFANMAQDYYDEGL